MGLREEIEKEEQELLNGVQETEKDEQPEQIEETQEVVQVEDTTEDH
jgi:hypothetical protein